jgi:2-methylcitrate dehydratase
VHGYLTADHYESAAASHPLIDRLRERMEVVEMPQYSRDYLDPDKRSIANSIQIYFTDGTQTERIEVEYPLGHRRRREEARSALMDKFQHNASKRLSNVDELISLFQDPDRLDNLPIPDFINLTLPPVPSRDNPGRCV